MPRISIGAALIVAGVAAFIEAHSHQPEAHHALPPGFNGPNVLGTLTLTSPDTGWSQTAYDLVMIGAGALVIFGAVLLIVGLIGYSRKAA
jgi:hypothetical protein